MLSIFSLQKIPVLWLIGIMSIKKQVPDLPAFAFIYEPEGTFTAFLIFAQFRRNWCWVPTFRTTILLYCENSPKDCFCFSPGFLRSKKAGFEPPTYSFQQSLLTLFLPAKAFEVHLHRL